MDEKILPAVTELTAAALRARYLHGSFCRQTPEKLPVHGRDIMLHGRRYLAAGCPADWLQLSSWRPVFPVGRTPILMSGWYE